MNCADKVLKSMCARGPYGLTSPGLGELSCEDDEEEEHSAARQVQERLCSASAPEATVRSLAPAQWSRRSNRDMRPTAPTSCGFAIVRTTMRMSGSCVEAVESSSRALSVLGPPCSLRFS